jgi:hypothetical protein
MSGHNVNNNMEFRPMPGCRAKPGPKIIKLSDGGGLQLWIIPDGSKTWRLAYRFGGAQKALAIGVYPTIGLKDARQSRDAARRDLARGQDPLQARREAKATQAERGANTSTPSGRTDR